MITMKGGEVRKKKESGVVLNKSRQESPNLDALYSLLLFSF